MAELKEDKSPNRSLNWLKKLGVAGFLFFLIKGLIWLSLFFGIAKCFTK